MHMYTKYEVSMSNPVPEGGVHRCPTLMPMMQDDDDEAQTLKT